MFVVLVLPRLGLLFVDLVRVVKLSFASGPLEESFSRPIHLGIGFVFRCPGILGVYLVFPFVPFAPHRWFPLLVFRRDHVEFGGEVNYLSGLRGFVNVRSLRAIVEFNLFKLVRKGIRIRSCGRNENFWFWLVLVVLG